MYEYMWISQQFNCPVEKLKYESDPCCSTAQLLQAFDVLQTQVQCDK